MIVYAIKFDNKYYDYKGGISSLEDCAFWGNFQELASLQNDYIKQGKRSIISYGKIIKVKIEEMEE